VDKDTARDWLMLGYVIAELTELAALFAALGAGLMWAAAAATFLFTLTVVLRRHMVHRTGSRWW
jgi:hypothetical protein